MSRPQPAARDVAAPAAATSGGCPGPEFIAFLAAFSERRAVQRQFTRFPLAYRTVEDTGGGPESVERAMPADSIRDPLYPSATQRARDGLRVRIGSAQGARRVVTLSRPDTDHQIEYTFERRGNGCWQLTRYDNQSL